MSTVAHAFSELYRDLDPLHSAPGQRHHEPARAASPSTISDSISTDIVRLYRGWDKFEKEHGGTSIVDFDLADVQGSEEIDSREDVLDRLTSLFCALLEGVSDESRFLRSRIAGSLAYVRTLLGEQIDFGSYILQTLGIEPEVIPDEELRSARQDVVNHLDNLGLSYQPAGCAAYEANLLTDPLEIQKEILSQKDLWTGRLADMGISFPELMPLTVKFDKVNAYWSNWIDGSHQSGITLTINLHERVRYDKGRALFLCLHEICGHAVQMSIWRDRIKNGTLSQACGITNVHSPEMFIAEGLAQSVPDLFDQSLFSSEFQVSRSLRYHTLLELHNAHLRLYRGVPVDLLLQQLADALPFSRRAELRSQLIERGTNPVYRTYLLAYSAGERMIRSKVKALGAKKLKLFERLYSFPITPGELRSWQP